MINHHPNADLLFDYATGSLPEALSLVAASHLSMCGRCRHTVEQYETLGGVLLTDIAPVATDGDLLRRTIARLDEPDPAPLTPSPEMDSRTLALIPSPLRSYLNGNVDQLEWRHIGRSISEFPLPVSGEGHNVALMRFRAGRPVVDHTHDGTEHTLVLAGGYHDHLASYRRGDVAYADTSVRHRPIADDDEDCICLVVLDAPTRLTGPIGRFLNPFLKS